MTLSTVDDLNEPLKWPEGGITRIPYRLYVDPEIYALEQQRIFRGPVWNFLCLEIDIPNAGDFKTSTVGEIPIIVTRDENGDVHAMVNRCVHKGALVCLKEKGNAKLLNCIYHSWSYDLQGRLKGVAFRNGLKGKGGLPDDFDASQHSLEPLRVELFCGLVFGTFSEETPSAESYFGKPMSDFMRRNLDRPLKPLGMHSQIIHNNWKLYAENVRDSYHATLLHTFYSTFKINRLDMDGGIILAEDKWHSISYAKRATFDEAPEYKQEKIHSVQYDDSLAGPQLLNSWPEFEDGITHSIQALFPNLAVQFTLNSLAVRFFVPRGIDKTELFWFYVGYERDDEAQTAMRVMQGNLTGASGLVSLEDGCINEFVQRGTKGSADGMGLAEMGGREVESSDQSRATETAIRGFWTGYRRIMDIA
ncbi:MAG: Rieske 2Fe-2S domain-containing protein [Rhodospirillaceae bacterium]|jgi:anthranilate 1,2-dioxygenase large subunit|nr:Rieske 2Fe-2S domain-containing protein [Rhodospirillaceae bacterium]MBT4486308.1 Rieske 2Fe-2S domain-containing protein [Rhodospirillaceae bacterium]MBT5192626.1 Rieske 2Fe-2S domain-containing protein [Rhodospirillaceae bacterium]MBT5899318.1 Rieske 2Fe-2S domain-containing protein [Rhodospirillaceae bacterium]MBT6426601.1 Rieske 2Fe-2S domain-containing protein [Rhodospirillaceae bacterium]